MRRMFVAGNWKMNTTRQAGIDLAKGLVAAVGSGEPGVDVAVCPPYLYLDAVKASVAGSAVTVGAQNCYFEKSGAFTGEVAPGMLVDIGCTWVILGHSERRAILGETDAVIAGSSIDFVARTERADLGAHAQDGAGHIVA